MSGHRRAPGRASGRAWSRAALLAPAALLAVAVAVAGAGSAAHVVAVAQKGRAFAVREVQVERGGAVRFTNEDDFPHQIAVRGAGYEFESDLQAPGGVVEVTPPSAGAFEVRCGVHPRMRMTIHVR